MRATSALLRAGTSVDETVAEVLAATERVGDPAWNWKAEQRKIERLCFDFVAKNQELSGTLPDDLRGAFEALVAQGGEPKFRCGRDGTWGLNYTSSLKGEEECLSQRREPSAVYRFRRRRDHQRAGISYRWDTAA